MEREAGPSTTSAASALKLTPIEMRKTVRAVANKHKQLRATLVTPYKNLRWPLINDADRENMCDTIKRILEPLQLGKLDVVIYPNDLKNRKEKHQYKRKKQMEHWQKNDPLRSTMVMGINGVTRAAEKNLLAAVLVCENTTPIMMTEHLIGLCAKNQIPAALVANLGPTVAKILNINSCSTLGFKKEVKDPSNSYHEIYKEIARIGAGLPKLAGSEWTDHVAVPSPKEDPLTSHEAAQIVTEARKDYSYLYVYKNEPRTDRFKPRTFAEDFLKLESDKEEESSGEVVEAEVKSLSFNPRKRAAQREKKSKLREMKLAAVRQSGKTRRKRMKAERAQ